MRQFSIVVAVAFAMILGSYAMAKDAATTAAKPLQGKVISAVTKDKVTTILISSHAKVKGDPNVETTITADDSTKVTKEGGTPTLADVVKDTIVNVTLGDNNKAVAIEIRAPHKKPAAAAAK